MGMAAGARDTRLENLRESGDHETRGSSLTRPTLSTAKLSGFLQAISSRPLHIFKLIT